MGKRKRKTLEGFSLVIDIGFNGKERENPHCTIHAPNGSEILSLRLKDISMGRPTICQGTMPFVRKLKKMKLGWGFSKKKKKRKAE